MKRLPASCVLVLLLLIPGAAGAQASNDPLIVRQRELRDLKNQIEENRRRIEELRHQEKDLGSLNERLRRDRDLTGRYLARLEDQEHAVLGDLSERQQQLDEKTQQQEKLAALLRKRLRLYQRARQPHTAELLLSSHSFAELFARGAMLARMIQKDRTDLIYLSEQREDLSTAASLLESRRNGLESLQEEKLREKARIEEKSAAAEDQIAKLRAERTEFERRQKDLAQTETQIRSLIQRLEEERVKPPLHGARIPAPSGPGLEGREGRLDWPTRGQVVGRFGLEMHPRFGTKVPSNGIDIAAPSGTPVHAVAAGTAEFVDWLAGYGRCVILNHGGGYYTLYAHCSRVLVRSGAKVAEGETIAEVGDTDSVKGTCLHFEIRHGQEAMDPQRWLR